MNSTHEFDFRTKVCNNSELSFYGQVKLINYIRRQVKSTVNKERIFTIDLKLILKQDLFGKLPHVLGKIRLKRETSSTFD